jgi:hypothetical protein
MPRRRVTDRPTVVTSHIKGLTVAVLVLALAVGLSLYRDAHARSLDGVAQRDARLAQTAIEGFYIGHHTYAADPRDLAKVDPRLASSHLLTATGTAETYTVSVTSGAPGGAAFSLTRSSDGSVVRTCDRAGHEGCPPAGVW